MMYNIIAMGGGQSSKELSAELASKFWLATVGESKNDLGIKPLFVVDLIFDLLKKQLTSVVRDGV
jgi:hypothetical protein